jgi:formate/nitrite transporter
MTEAINFSCKSTETVADLLTNTTCVKKANISFWNIIILGIMAGVYIGFGGMMATLIATDAAKFVGLGLSKVITGAVFSVGLMLVVIAGAELFTGNNLMLMGVLEKKIKIHQMLYKWLLVFIANFIGALLLAYIAYATGLWKGNNFAIGAAALKIAHAKVTLTWMEAFTRGFLCNILVCLAVWMAMASNNIIGKIWAIFFPIMTFVALGFEHSIANMYFIPMGIMLKGTPAAHLAGINLSALTWNNFIFANLIPVTLGNIVGGSLFVGTLYWYVYVKNKATK